MDEDLENPRFLPLHRFKSAEWSGEDSYEPKGFSIDKYLEENNLGYLYSKKSVALDVVFYGSAGFHLSETPLSKDQQISEDKKRGGFGGAIDLSSHKSAHHKMLEKGGILKLQAQREIENWYRYGIQKIPITFNREGSLYFPLICTYSVFWINNINRFITVITLINIKHNIYSCNSIYVF